IAAAHALEKLPRTSEALGSGELHVDKAVELTRFATPETESRVGGWAGGVSGGAIRRKADIVARRSSGEAEEAERSRFLSWWTFDEGRRFGLEAELPSAQGVVVAKVLDRLADGLPVMPEERGPAGAGARRVDALVALCSSGDGADRDPDRATLVVHARLDGPDDDLNECEIEDGPAISPDTARRFACNARVQTVVEEEKGLPVKLGRTPRKPRPW